MYQINKGPQRLNSNWKQVMWSDESRFDLRYEDRRFETFAETERQLGC